MYNALSKQNLAGYTVTVIFVFFVFAGSLYAQKQSDTENPFYNYLAQKFQEKKLPEGLSKKVWNYISNPSKGYKYAGLTPEEYAQIVRDYVNTYYQKKIIESLSEVLKIETRENLPDEKKSENTAKYIKHIEKLADEFHLSVMNLQNRYLVVYSNGEQPPLGFAGKIKTSDNYLRYDEPLCKDGIIPTVPVITSKTAVELAIFSAGILNSIGLRPANRVIFYIDLSLSLQTNVDILFNSYELAPVNLVLDSVFPLACAEYGYAMIRVVQNFGEKDKKPLVKKVLTDGDEYLVPSNSYICLDNEKVEKEVIRDKISKFLVKYNKADIRFDEDNCIKFTVPQTQRGDKHNALDYAVLFLSENRDFFPEHIKIFEYLRRNIALNSSGKILGINRHHNLLKNTEVVLKKVRVNGNSCSADIYIRFPYGIESSVLVEKVKTSVEVFNSKESSDIEVYVNAYNPLVLDSNSEVAKRIRKAYNNVTGGSDKCVTADGLYSKLFPNAIGFGPDFGELSKSSCVYEKDIMKIFGIYLTAMIYLMEK